MPLSQTIAQKLTASRQTISVAESCTGGLLSHTLTNISGSSTFFTGAIVAYANDTKIRLVNVPAPLIIRHGAVSAPVARAMAQGIRKALKTDLGIGITGIAGPAGGTKTKPVGLVFIAVSSPQKTIVQRCVFKGTRISIKRESVKTTLEILLTFL